jgi:hypothetical protein
MEENKQEICNKLCVALQCTKGQSDLIRIEYKAFESGREVARMIYEGGSWKEANVSADSGTAMIRDIMEAIK